MSKNKLLINFCGDWKIGRLEDLSLRLMLIGLEILSKVDDELKYKLLK